MSKGYGYHFTGTITQIIGVAASFPKTGDGLLAHGWEDISHPLQAAKGSYTYRDPNTGLRVRFDKAKPGAPGFSGRNHYHILNPDAHSSHDMYLDKNGNPCARGSKKSHILPEGEN